MKRHKGGGMEGSSIVHLLTSWCSMVGIIYNRYVIVDNIFQELEKLKKQWYDLQ